MATKRIKRKALRRRDIPETEAFHMLREADKKGRRAIRRVVLRG